MQATTPQLRFPEFTDRWQVKKLGNIIRDYKESSKTQDEYPVMTSSRSGIILQRDYYGSNNRITDRDNAGYNILPPNYLTYRSRSDDGIFRFNLNRTGATGLVSYFYPVFTVDGEVRFFEEYLNTAWKTLYKHSVGTSQKVLAHTELKKIDLPIPASQEQEKIAEFLSVVDTRIAASVKKLELLQKYKKSVMQKIFAQAARFKDENGNPYPKWEEKRLGEIVSLSMGQSPSSRSYNSDGVGLPLVQGNADIMDRKTIPRYWTSEPTKTCEKGDIILTVRAPSGYVAISSGEACIGRGVCSIRPKPETSTGFLYQFLLWFEPYWVGIEQGSTFSAISGDDIRNLSVRLPSTKEQQKIATLLTALDAKIAAEQTRLTAAKQWKKGLLQRMFV